MGQPAAPMHRLRSINNTAERRSSSPEEGQYFRVADCLPLTDVFICPFLIMAITSMQANVRWAG